MKRFTCQIATALLLLTINGCAASDSSSETTTSRTDDETVALGVRASAPEDGDMLVALDECPAAVQDTIEAHLDGGSILEIERTTDHDEVLYEVDIQQPNGVTEFDVAEDGAFRGFEGRANVDDEEDLDADDDDDADEEEDGEEGIPLSEVPDLVKAAAIAAVPGLVLEEAERETENGMVIYDLEGEADGKEYEIEVNAAGKVLEIEVDDEDDDDDDEEEDEDDD